MRRIIAIIAIFAAGNYLIKYSLSFVGIEAGPAGALAVLAATSLPYSLIYFNLVQPPNARPRTIAIYRWIGILGLFVILNIWSLAFREAMPALWALGGPLSPFSILSIIAMITCAWFIRSARFEKRKSG